MTKEEKEKKLKKARDIMDNILKDMIILDDEEKEEEEEEEEEEEIKL